MASLKSTRPGLFVRLFSGRHTAKSATAQVNERLSRLEGQVHYLEGVRNQWEASLPRLLKQTDQLAKLGTLGKLLIGRIDQAVAAGNEINEHMAAHDERLQALERADVATADALRPRLEEIRMELGSRIDHAAAVQDESVRKLWERLELVRREALLEIRYGVPKDSGGLPNVVGKEKLERLRENGLKLNLGCGHIPLDGFVNVDLRDLPGVDVIADGGNLPFEPGTVDKIFSAHLLEHFPQEELKRRLLPYWFGLLPPGGEFRAVVPDGEAMLNAISDGSYSFEDFRTVLFGGQDYDGDFHFNLFTPASLAHILREVGFDAVQCVEKGRRNGQCFEFEIAATRPRCVPQLDH